MRPIELPCTQSSLTPRSKCFTPVESTSQRKVLAWWHVQRASRSEHRDALMFGPVHRQWLAHEVFAIDGVEQLLHSLLSFNSMN